jgi:hypothetical protein
MTVHVVFSSFRYTPAYSRRVASFTATRFGAHGLSARYEARRCATGNGKGSAVRFERTAT